MFVMVKEIVQKEKMKVIVQPKENVKRILIAHNFVLPLLMGRKDAHAIQVTNWQEMGLLAKISTNAYMQLILFVPKLATIPLGVLDVAV